MLQVLYQGYSVGIWLGPSTHCTGISRCVNLHITTVVYCSAMSVMPAYNSCSSRAALSTCSCLFNSSYQQSGPSPVLAIPYHCCCRMQTEATGSCLDMKMSSKFSASYTAGELLAGCSFTASDVPLHISATLLFDGDRSAFFECGFDRAPVQYSRGARTYWCCYEGCEISCSVVPDHALRPRHP